jgi:hypothetical protein
MHWKKRQKQIQYLQAKHGNDLRLRTAASFAAKSWCHAATKSSSKVTTTGANAVRTVSTKATSLRNATVRSPRTGPGSWSIGM